MQTYLTLDVGGSKYIVALLSREGEVLAKRGGAWSVTTAEEVLDVILAESRALLNETGITPVACGITIPGLADPEKGLWVEAQFSGIRDFAICEEVEKALGIPKLWGDVLGVAMFSVMLKALSSIATSMYWPSPVISLWCSAMRMPMTR